MQKKNKIEFSIIKGFGPSTFNIVPKVGDFYFFPHYMMHTVFPFKDTDEERRSISFNAEIDDKIYNVYGA